ncbi:MAG: biotin/lipoyl-binding protein [Dehalococcoidia bacterium]|nr:biotin/lipoyl-binding protein [Dehalococcoidia bacterium]MYA52027.1 biotin/lipoyl-binding protein [Dehalococcoidia bacterium]
MATVTIGGRTYEVEVRGDTVVVDGEEFPIAIARGDAYDTVTAGAVSYRVALPPEEERESGMAIEVDHRPFTLKYEGRLGGGPARPAPRASSAAAGGAPAVSNVPGGVAAQLSGKVLRIEVQAGDAVEAGQLLLVLEAMKMENEINAPKAGTVKEVLVGEGAQVAEGETLVVLE